jgi:hypothetical protein
MDEKDRIIPINSHEAYQDYEEPSLDLEKICQQILANIENRKADAAWAQAQGELPVSSWSACQMEVPWVRTTDFPDYADRPEARFDRNSLLGFSYIGRLLVDSDLDEVRPFVNIRALRAERRRLYRAALSNFEAEAFAIQRARLQYGDVEVVEALRQKIVLRSVLVGMRSFAVLHSLGMLGAGKAASRAFKLIAEDLLAPSDLATTAVA